MSTVCRSFDACAALAGHRDECPDNDGVQHALRAMLSPFIVRQMREQVGRIYANLCK